jgi:hypothetical protein
MGHAETRQSIVMTEGYSGPYITPATFFGQEHCRSLASYQVDPRGNSGVAGPMTPNAVSFEIVPDLDILQGTKPSMR